MATLRPGYEIMYPKGVPHDDVKARFSELFGIPLERVVILEDGGGIFCSERTDDGGQVGIGDNDDVSGDGDSGDIPERGCAGTGEVTDANSI